MIEFRNRRLAHWTRLILGTAVCLSTVAACAPSRGPGSTRHAEAFCNRRLTDLATDSIMQTPDGKWLCKKLELRNADFKITTAGADVHAQVVYEYRTHRSPEFSTKSEAMAAIPLPLDTDFTAVKEDYDFRDGEWVLRH